MSGTPKLKPAKNNQEWARNMQKQADALQSPTAQRVGDWVLSTNPDSGDLLGSNVNGGSVILAKKPEPSDNADQITSTGSPYIKLERQQYQNAPTNTTTLVRWDTVAYQTSGWGFAPAATDVVIHEDGIYKCLFHLAFRNSTTYVCKGVFLIDGVVKMAQEYAPDTVGWYQGFYMVDDFPLNSGQLISCGAYQQGGSGGNYDFGPSGADPTVFTSMSLLKLPVD